MNIQAGLSGTLVLGIGNPILRDDRVGCAVIKELKKIISEPDISLQSTNLAGFSLLDAIAGYDYIIIVDSILSGSQPGEVLHLTLDDFQIETGSFVSQHQVGVLEAIELGRSLGLTRPSRVDIIAIEARDITNFGEYLTPEVAAAVPVAVQKVHELLTPFLTKVKKA